MNTFTAKRVTTSLVIVCALSMSACGSMSTRDKIKDKLLDKRSVVMAERAIPVANEKPIFMAVGASHLAGDVGLISAFKKAGYKLTALPK